MTKSKDFNCKIKPLDFDLTSKCLVVIQIVWIAIIIADEFLTTKERVSNASLVNSGSALTHS